MSGEDERDTTSAAALRRAFDAAFAAALPPAPAGFEDVLAIRLGGDAYVLRLSEIAGLYVDRAIVALPSPHPALLGIAALRRQLVPVYDLGSLLGYARGDAARWFALGPAPRSIGLAFAELERPLRLSQRSFSGASGEAPTRRHVRGIVRVEAAVRSIIDVDSLLGSLAGAPELGEGAARNG